jgi:hypothetical protein
MAENTIVPGKFVLVRPGCIQGLHLHSPPGRIRWHTCPLPCTGVQIRPCRPAHFSANACNSQCAVKQQPPQQECACALRRMETLMTSQTEVTRVLSDRQCSQLQDVPHGAASKNTFPMLTQNDTSTLFGWYGAAGAGSCSPCRDQSAV